MYVRGNYVPIHDFLFFINQSLPFYNKQTNYDPTPTFG